MRRAQHPTSPHPLRPTRGPASGYRPHSLQRRSCRVKWRSRALVALQLAGELQVGQAQVAEDLRTHPAWISAKYASSAPGTDALVLAVALEAW